MVWPSVAVKITAEVVHAPGPEEVGPFSPEGTVEVGPDWPKCGVGVDPDSPESAVEPGMSVISGSPLDVN